MYTKRTLKDIDDYRASPAVSQSQLKNIYEGKEFKGETRSMLFGSLLDCLLTTPHLYDEIYLESKVSRPSETIVTLCKNFQQWVGQMGLELDPNLDSYGDLKGWLLEQEYFSNANQYNTFVSKASEWWEELVQVGDKVLISSSEKATYESLASLARMKFDLSGEKQLPFYFEYQGVECKGLGDVVNRESKIYKDVKFTTCNSVKEWIRVAAKLMYPFQMSFYRDGLSNSYDYGDWKMIWVVVGSGFMTEIECSDTLMNMYKSGFEIKKNINGEKVVHEFPGWEKLLHVKKWDVVDFEQEYLRNLG